MYNACVYSKTKVSILLVACRLSFRTRVGSALTAPRLAVVFIARFRPERYSFIKGVDQVPTQSSLRDAAECPDASSDRSLTLLLMIGEADLVRTTTSSLAMRRRGKLRNYTEKGSSGSCDRSSSMNAENRALPPLMTGRKTKSALCHRSLQWTQGYFSTPVTK